MSGPVLTTAWITEMPGGDVVVSKASSTSQQLGEDPFAYNKDAGESGLVRPLYDLDQLAAMPETNTLHARCVRQKATDVAGRGFSLRADHDAPDGDAAASSTTAAEQAWEAFVTSVEEDERGDETFGERITMAAQDYESVGWGVLEVSRALDSKLDGLWHVPGHTVRAHADGRRFAQRRGGKLVWFKRFGLAGDVDKVRGGWSPTPLDASVRGNELIVLRNYTPRSDFYGLPDHIPAFAAIAGWRAQAEFNVRFFDNHAVPSYAVVIEGADISPELEELIKSHFRQIKGDPSRTIVIPIPAGAGDEASAPKLRFERLSVEVKDASFRLYKQDNALEICISHGMPPYRVGWPILGSLGGSTAVEMTQIYNDSIVEPRQEVWEQRLNRTLLGAKGLQLSGVELKAKQLDTRDMESDVAVTKQLFEMGAITPEAIAKFYNLDERKDPNGKLYLDQIVAFTSKLAGPFGATPIPTAPVETGIPNDPAQAMMKRWTTEVRELSAIRKRIAELVDGQMAAAA